MSMNWLYRLWAVWDCRPMPAGLASVWGVFLHEGLMGQPVDPDRPRRILEIWGRGYIGLIIASCESLDPLWQAVSQTWYEPHGHPGLFEREVVSLLGQWLGDQLLATGDLPTPKEAKRHIDTLVRGFFEINEDTPLLTDRAA